MKRECSERVQTVGLFRVTLHRGGGGDFSVLDQGG